jgi:hypothetical protein
VGRHGGSRRLVSDRGLMIMSLWVAAVVGAGQLGVSILGLASPAVIRVSAAPPGLPAGGYYPGDPPGPQIAPALPLAMPGGGLDVAALRRLRRYMAPAGLRRIRNEWLAAVSSSGPAWAGGVMADALSRIRREFSLG